MKKICLGWMLGLGLALAAGSALALGSFEGIVNYEMVTSGKTMNIEYMIKGQKIRSDMQSSGMQGSMIMDMSAKKMTMLMHKQKMYSISTMDKSMIGEAAKSYEGKFYKASGSKTILGHKCEHWVYEGKSGKGDIWATTSLGAFAGMGSQGSGSAKLDDWVKAIKAKGMFMLENDYVGKDGKTMTMTATKVEAKSLSASLFEVPAGYKKIPSMGEMTGSTGSGKQPSKEDILKAMKPKLPF